MPKGAGRLLPLLVIAFFVATSVSAQVQITAGIRGVVLDPMGAVVPAARLTVTNVDTGLTQAISTDSSGVYTFTLLPVGTYTLELRSADSLPYEQSGITLSTNQVRGLNITLKLAGMTQTVEVVSASPVAVNTQTTEISTLIHSEQIKELPLNSRNPLQLATLTNGINDSSIPDTLGGGSRSMNRLLVNGNQGFMTQYSLDGGEFQEPTLNAGYNFPNPDALQEFRFITNMYSAEFGKSAGGVVNVVTKSGTNKIHGDLWEFNRNAVVAARPFFLPKVPALNRNMFGFTLGGPVRKDKVFLN